MRFQRRLHEAKRALEERLKTRPSLLNSTTNTETIFKVCASRRDEYFTVSAQRCQRASAERK